MQSCDPRAFAVNGAGIADAFRMAQLADPDGDNRLAMISDDASGWVCVMERIGEAAEIMEAVRCEHGSDAAWGAGLPYLYDVWDEIAQALWDNFERSDLEGLVRGAIAEAEAADRRDI